MTDLMQSNGGYYEEIDDNRRNTTALERC